MKTLKKNVQNFKNILLEAQTKHIELKNIARMSSKDPKFNQEETSIAQSKLVSDTDNLHRMYIAYYIVKHNIQGEKREEIIAKDGWLYGCHTINRLVEQYEKDTDNA